jgi:iron complex outermembrane receptor protein
VRTICFRDHHHALVSFIAPRRCGDARQSRRLCTGIQPRRSRRHLHGSAGKPARGSAAIPNSASDTKGGAVGASLIGDAARGGLSWSRYETNYGIVGEEEAFIDMKQDRYDAKAELDFDGPIEALHFDGSYNDYTHTELEGPGEPGTIFNQDAHELRVTADHKFGDGWRGTVGAQYVDIDFEALGDEAFVPRSKTQVKSKVAAAES